ncbi:MAG: type II toxin-antitoxin system HicB family antitoxin [Solirubrobacterales bacterium]
MEYVVIYEQGDTGGWGAHSPDLPGCYALGDSRAEVEDNMREAIVGHLEELRRRGQTTPKASNFVGVVSVPVV